MDKKVMAGIVTFNPEIERLEINIDVIMPQVSELLVVDNNSKNIKSIENLINRHKNIQIIQNKKNLGIARALNQIGEFANKKDYYAFLTLDQDSVADKELVKKLLLPLQSNEVGMTCPYINRKNDFVPNEALIKKSVAVTSGSMVKTKVWEEIGGFWEYLFIDEVDHEFCYQIKNKGYQIIQVNFVTINHIIGVPFEKTIMGHTFNPTNHSSFRRYYIVRNDIIIKHLYPNEKEPFPDRYLMIFRMAVSILLCEKKKREKIFAMLKGIHDAISWILVNGKTIERRREHLC